MTSRAVFPWLLRAAWIALPFAAGSAYGAALRPHSEPVRLAAEVLLWAVWSAVLVGTLVPWPVGLTGLRVVAPAAAVTAVAAALTGRPSPLAAGAAVAITLADTVLALSPMAALLYINGPAYPNERRYPLRVPGPLLLGPLEVAWAVTIGLPAAAILLLAAKQWVVGASLTVIGVPAAVVAARSLHGLARRWVVFVPAGLVLHDPMTLTDPTLLQRQLIERLRPAPVDSDALDLTQRSPGLALELVLREEVPIMLARPGRSPGEPRTTDRILFTPTRPGQVLQEAQTRRLPVG
jgi:hypothetical protein